MFSKRYLNIRKFVSVVFMFSFLFSSVLPVATALAHEGHEHEEVVVEESVVIATTEEVVEETVVETVVETTSEAIVIEESDTALTKEVESEVEVVEEEVVVVDASASSISLSSSSASAYVPNFNHTCLLPNSLGDTTVEAVVHGNDTYSLQDRFDQKGINKNVITDQKQYKVWDAINSATDIKVEFVSKDAALTSVVGYYRNSNILPTFVPLFKTGATTIGGYESVPVFSQGMSTTTTISGAGLTGFVIKVNKPDSSYYLWSTENYLNGSEDHAVVYEVADNEYIIAFEDLPLTSSDLDWNDVVIKVSVLGCNNGQTPINTPPSITLVGANPTIVTLGNSFTDLGATATDAEDGNLTSGIVVTGTVSTSTVGTSTLTYTVTDSGGLSASTTRTVIISATSTTPSKQCSDGLDNDGDSKIDATDPACHTDNDPNNSGSYDPNKDDETDPTTPTTPTNTNGGGGGGNGGGGSLGGGHRRDISNLLSVGEVLGATSCSYLRDYLKIGWENDKVEVLKLQSFLNLFESENLALTGVFNQETFSAVETFQNKYKSDILTPWGHTAPTGFVYILTKKKVNEIYCNTLLTLNQADKDEINAFRAMIESNPGMLIQGQNIGSKTEVKSGSGTDVVYNNTIVVPSDSENEIKDNNATSSTLVVRNAAVSLFGATQKIFTDVKYTILFLVLFILLVTLLRWLFGLKDSDDIDSTEYPTGTNTEAEISIGEGAKKESQDLLPEEEIIIEDETVPELPVFPEDEDETKTN